MWGVLPGECVRGGCVVRGGLVEVRRRVERERVKDGLRGWVGEWRYVFCAVGTDVKADFLGRRRGWESRMDAVEEQKPDVRRLVRRFARDKDANGNAGRSGRWGRNAEGRKMEEPTRAKVLGLKRFWEKVGREGVSS